MTELRSTTKALIAAMAAGQEPDDAALAVWEAARVSDDDPNLVALAEKLADLVMAGGTHQELDLAARCYGMALACIPLTTERTST